MDERVKELNKINWFPGHMMKATNEIKEKLKLVDFVIFLLDSRVIRSSYNKYLMEIVKDKPKLFILTKEDLSDDNETLKRKEKLEENKEDSCLIINLLDFKVLQQLEPFIQKMSEGKREKALKKGIKNIVVRALVIGIPNVGKSTFINLLSKKAIAKTGNMPGVTRNVRWIKVNQYFEIMDTPGILLPRFEKIEEAYNLSLIGTIREDILPLMDVFTYLIDFIKKNYSSLFLTRYEIDLNQNDDLINILEVIGKKRGFLKSKGEVDLEKTIKVILNEFKNGKIGKITLEKVI